MIEEFTTMRFEVDDAAIGRLVLSAPERRNPLGWTFARELRHVATWCDEMQEVRCLLITAEGPWFSAGGDISFFSETNNLLMDMAGSTNDFHVGISKLLRMRAPVVIGVQGPAVGAGVSLLGLGDVVVCGESAHFRFGYTGIGFSPEGGSSWTLPRLIGLRRYQELALTNRKVDSWEAAAIGLVTKVVPDDQVADEAERLATQIASGPTEAYGGVRRLLLETFTDPLEVHLERELRELTSRCRTDDVQEGLAAVRERRTPAFKGR